MFADLFESLGAAPVVVTIAELYDALKTRRVHGQENPLVVTEVNRLYEVTRYVAITNDMWSGFNLLANGRFWSGLPSDVQAIIERNVAIHVARQQEYTQRLNRELESRLVQRGLVLNPADVASFRRRLGDGFYRRWKAELGTTAWRLLEAEVGPLT